ncbi:hypothetical protein EAE96_009921 [Botrytis aclada]|nr:hypothetical protein EAE96_009921 [Botrytis aclada]
MPNNVQDRASEASQKSQNRGTGANTNADVPKTANNPNQQPKSTAASKSTSSKSTSRPKAPERELWKAVDAAVLKNKLDEGKGGGETGKRDKAKTTR